jgi:hypothetical protein
MNLVQLEEYRAKPYNEFSRRRVFIVLNGVWKEGGLEQLDLANGQGKVTLVTTKNQHVWKKSRMIDEGKVNINVLSLDDSWRLFFVHVFPRGLLNFPLDELQ